MNDYITAVVGFSRSGTSLMMRMLHAGGMEVLADNHASFEDMRANTLPRNSDWLNEAVGKAVKILEPIHFTPPRKFTYRFIWMRRDPVEQAKSQMKFLREVGGMPIGHNEWKRVSGGIVEDTPHAIATLKNYPKAQLIEVRFEDLLQDTVFNTLYLCQFLERELDRKKMLAQVVRRSPACYPGFLETRYVSEDVK